MAALMKSLRDRRLRCDTLDIVAVSDVQLVMSIVLVRDNVPTRCRSYGSTARRTCADRPGRPVNVRG